MHEFKLYLSCGHVVEVKMTIANAKYRRLWLKELPMQAWCSVQYCRKMKNVTGIYTNNAEELFDMKAKEAGA